MSLGNKNFDIYNGFVPSNGPPLKEKESLKNVDIKHKDGRVVITFERSVKFFSSFTGKSFDLSECNNILVSSGRELFEGFDFHSIPQFTDTCYKIASILNQESQILPNYLSQTTTTAATTTSSKSKFKTPLVVPGNRIKYVRKYKLLIRMTLVMKYTSDYRNTNSFAYRKLEDKVDRYLRDSLGPSYINHRIESIFPGSVRLRIVLDYKDDPSKTLDNVLEDVWFKLLFGNPEYLNMNPAELLVSEYESYSPKEFDGAYRSDRKVSAHAILLPIMIFATILFIIFILGCIIFSSGKQQQQSNNRVTMITSTPNNNCQYGNKDIAPMPCSQLNTTCAQDDVVQYEKIDIIDCSEINPKVETIINENGKITTISTTLAPQESETTNNSPVTLRDERSTSDASSENKSSFQTSESIRNEANFLSVNNSDDRTSSLLSSTLSTRSKTKYIKSNSASIVRDHQESSLTTVSDKKANSDDKSSIKSKSSTNFKITTRQNNHEYENEAYNFY